MWRTHTLQNSSLASPPDKPPIAMPGVSLFTISRQHVSRRSRSKPPCMIQKRFCESGFLCAAIQRSSQRIERYIASLIRSRSGEVVAITSSSCIMMSEPIEFWRDIECSGVSSLSLSALEEEQPLAIVHRCSIMRAEKADAFLCDFGKFKETDHLESVFD
jgi:hypothetical protein